MASPRDIRRLAFQTLFQLDARGGDDAGALRDVVDESARDSGAEFTTSEKDKALRLALDAYHQRAEADAVMTELAPTWPVSRQAAVDRAILRLSYHEMLRTQTPPKVVVNEAVELAKVFSTEKSPTFINGLLDKVLKRVLASRQEQAPTDAAEPTDPNPTAPPTPEST